MLLWAVAGLILVTIGRVHQMIPVLGAIKPAFLLYGAAAFLVVTNPGRFAFKNITSFWPGRVVLGLFVLACLSVPFGISMGGSAVFILNIYSKVILLALLVMGSVRSASDLRFLVKSYVAAAGFIVFMALFLFDIQPASGGAVARLNNLYTYDANDIGLVMATGLPLAILLYRTSDGIEKLLYAFVVVGVGLTVAVSGSRGSFLGLVVVGIGLLFAMKDVSVPKRIMVLAVVGLAVTIMAPPGYWTQMRTILEPTEDYNWTSVYGRKAIAERGFGYMLKRPIFGVGIDNFGRAEATLSEEMEDLRILGGAVRWIAPHNSYVEVGAELGVTGLLLWGFLVFGGIVAPLRLRRGVPPPRSSESKFRELCCLYLPISFLGFAVTSAFLSFAFLDPIYVLGGLLTGLIVSFQGATRRGGRRVSPARAGRRS